MELGLTVFLAYSDKNIPGIDSVLLSKFSKRFLVFIKSSHRSLTAYIPLVSEQARMKAYGMGIGVRLSLFPRSRAQRHFTVNSAGTRAPFSSISAVQAAE